MSLIAFYDTETSGLPDFKVPSEMPHQPHIVDIAVVLYDDATDQVIDTFEAMVIPGDWTIPDDVAAIHGITTEIAKEQGTHCEADALYGALSLLDAADSRAGHNESFDQRIMRIAMMRYGTGDDEGWFSLSSDEKRAICDGFKGRASICTMKLATPIMKIPATPAMVRTGKGKWHKNPNLGEAYQHFVGKPFEGAHRAMADTMGALEIYRVMKRDGHL